MFLDLPGMYDDILNLVVGVSYSYTPAGNLDNNKQVKLNVRKLLSIPPRSHYTYKDLVAISCTSFCPSQT